MLESTKVTPCNCKNCARSEWDTDMRVNFTCFACPALQQSNVSLSPAILIIAAHAPCLLKVPTMNNLIPCSFPPPVNLIQLVCFLRNFFYHQLSFFFSWFRESVELMLMWLPDEQKNRLISRTCLGSTLSVIIFVN